MLQAAIIFASAASLALVAWAVLAVMGTSRRRAVAGDHVAAATFALLASSSLCLFRVVVVQATRASGPLPFFVFLGVPLGLALTWLSIRMARQRG